MRDTATRLPLSGRVCIGQRSSFGISGYSSATNTPVAPPSCNAPGSAEIVQDLAMRSRPCLPFKKDRKAGWLSGKCRIKVRKYVMRPPQAERPVSAIRSLRTGAEYLRSLKDGRQVFVGGEKVADVTKHPAFREATRSVARLYDIAAAPYHSRADAQRCLVTVGRRILKAGLHEIAIAMPLEWLYS